MHVFRIVGVFVVAGVAAGAFVFASGAQSKSSRYKSEAHVSAQSEEDRTPMALPLGEPHQNSASIPARPPPFTRTTSQGDKMPAASRGVIAENDEVSGEPLEEEGVVDKQRRSMEERVQMVKRLVDSGPALPGTFQRAEKVVATWRDKSPPELRNKASLSSFECYRGGCVTNASYTDFMGFQSFSENFTRSEGFLAWPGPKYRSGPEVDPQTGKVSSVWILMSPEE